MTTFKQFLVGGPLRDEALGLPVDDLDFCLEPSDLTLPTPVLFAQMQEWLKERGAKIVDVHERALTVRAKMPDLGHCDFALTSTEEFFDPATRQATRTAADVVTDLGRRDLTANAMARGEDGVLLDPFGGMQAIRDRVLDTPGDPLVPWLEDPLRIPRAFRFLATLDGFEFSDRLVDCLVEHDEELLEAMKLKVSPDRLVKEFMKGLKAPQGARKMFTAMVKFASVDMFDWMTTAGGLWFMPTTRAK